MVVDHGRETTYSKEVTCCGDLRMRHHRSHKFSIVRVLRGIVNDGHGATHLVAHLAESKWFWFFRRKFSAFDVILRWSLPKLAVERETIVATVWLVCTALNSSTRPRIGSRCPPLCRSRQTRRSGGNALVWLFHRNSFVPSRHRGDLDKEWQPPSQSCQERVQIDLC